MSHLILALTCMLLASMFGLSVSSCGPDVSVSRTMGEIDTELEQIETDFLGDLLHLHVPVSHAAPLHALEYDSIDASLLGLCTSPPRRIQIQPRCAGNTDQLRAVVAHEIMHCMFDMPEHDPEPGHIFSSVGLTDDAEWSAEKWSIEMARAAAWILEHSPRVQPKKENN